MNNLSKNILCFVIVNIYSYFINWGYFSYVKLNYYKKNIIS